jgi:hypothetical protein
MVKTVYSIGCSHTNGCMIDGINGTSEVNKQNSFAGQIAKRLKATNYNLSLNGASNQYIFRIANQVVAQVTDSDDTLFIIGWTSPTRLELREDNKIFPGHPEGYDNNYIPFSVGANKDNFSKEYKRLLNDAPAMCNITMLIDHWTCYIIALQNLFAQHKIRYIMCNTMQPIEQTSNNSDMIKMIDTSNYYKPFDVDESFYNWANLNYERTPCHHFPLKAHKDYAVKIMKEMKL